MRAGRTAYPQAVRRAGSAFNDRRDSHRRPLSDAGVPLWKALTLAALPRVPEVRRLSRADYQARPISRSTLARVRDRAGPVLATVRPPWTVTRVPLRFMHPRVPLQAKSPSLLAQINQSWQVFRAPPAIHRRALVCVRRRQRKEVIHALGFAGRNGVGGGFRSKPYRRTLDSSYSCGA